MSSVHNSELDSIKSKIQKLTSKTENRGCTEHEALAAAEKIGKLLQLYNLSMSDIVISKEEVVEQKYSFSQKTIPSYSSCFANIAYFCDCKCWFSRSYKVMGHSHTPEGISIYYFGLEKDVEVALYLTEIIDIAVKTQSVLFKMLNAYKQLKKGKKSSLTSFQAGMSASIYHRLAKMKDILDEQIRDRESKEQNCKALVLINKIEKVEKFFTERKKTIHFTKSKRRTTVRDHEGYKNGVKAGDKVNLNRPITANKTSIGSIT